MSDILLQVMKELSIIGPFNPLLISFRVGNSKAWSKEIKFKTDCQTAMTFTFTVMGDMGTVIPAGFLVAKQISEDHQITPFSAVVHVSDISYAGTGSSDEIAVGLENMPNVPYFHLVFSQSY